MEDWEKFWIYLVLEEEKKKEKITYRNITKIYNEEESNGKGF